MSAKAIRVVAARLVPSIAVLTALVVPGAAPSVMAAPLACDQAGVVQVGVVARALPAVVNIWVVKVVQVEGTGGAVQEHLEAEVGSGFVIDPTGVIVTNQHVIQNAAVLRVTFSDHSQVPAKLIVAASLLDLALLKVGVPHPLETLQFGNSDALRVGQPVIAIGNPLGVGTSVSSGVVSALDRDLMRTPFDNFIQTDAAINPGNSGGPLIDCAGDVIGIDTALYSNNKMLGSIGLGFALPSNLANFVSNRLLHPQNDNPSWFGLRLQDLTQSIATVFHRPNTDGAIITGTDPGSPAASSDLAPGDIITAVDGHEWHDSRAVLRALTIKQAGDPAVLSVWRRGHMSNLTLRGQAWPHLAMLRGEVLASAASIERAEAEGIGLHLTAITPTERQRLGLGDQSGILIDEVLPGSQADSVGLKSGDVIERVGTQPTTSVSALNDELRYGSNVPGDLVALLVRSKTSTRWVTIYVGRVNVASLMVEPSQLQTPMPAAASAGVEGSNQR